MSQEEEPAAPHMKRSELRFAICGANIEYRLLLVLRKGQTEKQQNRISTPRLGPSKQSRSDLYRASQNDHIHCMRPLDCLLEASFFVIILITLVGGTCEDL